MDLASQLTSVHQTRPLSRVGSHAGQVVFVEVIGQRVEVDRYPAVVPATSGPLAALDLVIFRVSAETMVADMMLLSTVRLVAAGHPHHRAYHVSHHS
jgi:hypothetical protein